MPAVKWDQRAQDLMQAGVGYNEQQVPAIRRLNDDLSRAMLDARERGLSDAQIGLRFLEVANHLTETVDHTGEQG